MTNDRSGASGDPAGLLHACLLDTTAGEGLLEAVARVESALREPAAGARVLAGLNGGAAAALLAGWRVRSGRAALVVTADRESAVQLADDLEAWLGPGSVVYLPQQEVLAFDHNSPEPSMVGDALEGLHRLRREAAPLVVTSLYGVRQRVMAPGTLDRVTIRLKCGQRRDMDDLGAALGRLGYRPAGMVAKVGDFARRGGLLDIFTPGSEPLRVEFFDDEIVSVRRFDVETQRTTERGDEAVILPVSHLHVDDEAILACLGRVEERLVAAGQRNDDLLEDLQAKLEDRLADEGLDTYLPWLGPTALLTDYLPEGRPCSGWTRCAWASSRSCWTASCRGCARAGSSASRCCRSATS